uniref:RNA-directed RNA polymerase L n=1 Tax=Atrato Gouko-like virus 1 TaxID=2689369 RepID=A0A6B9KNB4_9VIRU|nr:RdRp [Atrato Gouko-like virus 1]
MTSLRGRMFPDIESLDPSSLEYLCYSSLYQIGEATCEFLEMDTIHYMQHVKYYSTNTDNFTIEKDIETGLWKWSIKIPAGGVPDDPDKYAFHEGARDSNGMRTLRHDIVGLSLSSSTTDIKLRTVFSCLKDQEAGNLSPDYHLKLNGVNYFIELTTTMATDAGGAENAIRAKLFKYGHPLRHEVKHDDPCVLIVIVVGRKFVMSNFELDPSLLDKLTFYMWLALSLEKKINALNLPALMTPLDTELEARKQEISRQIDMLPVMDVPSGNLNITKEFIDSLDSRADTGLVFEYFSREVLKAKKSTTKVRLEGAWLEEMHEKRKQYEEKMRSQESRTCAKAIVGVPLFVVPRSHEPNSDIKSYPLLDEDLTTSAVLSLWEAGLRGGITSFEEYEQKRAQTLEELYFTDREKQEEVEARNKENKKTAHRVNIKGVLSEAERHELALDGLWGKRYKEDALKKDKQREAKLPYHYDVPINDISSFMEDENLFSDYEHFEEGSLSMRLIEKSMGDLGQLDSEALKSVRLLSSCKIACALEILSDIAMELTISLKQHVKGSDEILVKKLAYYEVYLIIIPTKASEHIFFSILVPPQEGLEALSCLPFKPLKPLHSGGFYTDFSSFRPDKLANIATSYATFFGICSYYTHHYRLNRATPQEILGNSDAVKMILFTTLVRLENKLATEEIITVSRYMFMEILKGNTWVMADPFRLIGKMTTCVRSRLQLFITKRLLSAFAMMLNNPPAQLGDDADETEEDSEEDVKCNDYWTGLINPYTLNQEVHAGRIVNLFYAGYAVDKDQVAQQNTDYKMIKKAIQKDREFNPAESHKSSGIWDDFDDTPDQKQFSPNVIKKGVELMQRVLESKHGPDYKEVMMEKITLRLSRLMTDELATLKASARIDHLPWHKLPPASQLLMHRTERCKVIEAIVEELVVFEHNPFLHLETIIHTIEITSRGVIADLFKKNQHGGLREIYVMTIKSRFAALYLETCSRCLCEEFECETMTHPDLKLEVVETHKMKARNMSKKTNRPLTELHCSADKKSWNNNLVMPALAIPLLMLLPKKMAGSIQRILNLWNERLIQLPFGVMRLLTSKTMLSCETYRDLYEEFYHPGSTGEQLFPQAQSGYCILRRGMMQGILHYTSSLLHVSYLFVSKHMISLLFKKIAPDAIVLIDQMCSSDDSASVFSILHPVTATEQQNQLTIAWMEIVCESLKTFCNYSCFTNSEKSVMGSPNQLEFNSEFMMGNTLAVPVIKWLFACYTVSESENLLMRQINFYNLMSQLYSSGLPAVNTTIVQISQALLHYQLLGSSTNQYFPLYYEEIKLYPDPSLGFFLIDNIFVPGALGFAFYHWFHCKTHKLFLLKKKSVAEGTLSQTPEGGFIDTFLIRHGNSRRYKALVERVSSGLDPSQVRDKVNENPYILFKEAGSLQDTEIKLLAKVLSPGTPTSLARGVPFVQAVASSVYGLQTYSYCRVEATYTGESFEKHAAKISLIGEVYRRRCLKDEENILDDDAMEALCFPNHLRFQTYLVTLAKYKQATKIPVRPMRHKKTTMRFQHATTSIGVSLFRLVKEKWAGVHCEMSHQLKQRCWDEYRKILPWLRDTLEESLEASPFLDCIELYNFVSSEAKRSRKLSRVGPAIRSSHPQAQIDQLARRTHQDGFILTFGREGVISESYRRYRDRRTSIGLALEVPMSSHREVLLNVAVRENRPTVDELSNLRDKTKREAILAIIVAKKCGEADSVIQKAVEDLGDGLFLSWSIAQDKTVHKVEHSSRVKVEWKGPGEAIISNRKLFCRLKTMDQHVTSIVTNDLAELTRLRVQLLSAMKDQGLFPGTTVKSGSTTVFLTTNGIKHMGPGTPVQVVTNNPSVRPPENPNLEFDVLVEQGCMHLIQKTCNNLPLKIISYRVYSKEIGSVQDSRIMDDVWNAWYRQARLNPEVAESTMNAIIQRMDDKTSPENSQERQETVKTFNFFRNTLKSRLKQKGYSMTAHKGFKPSPAEGEEEEVDSLVDLDFEEIEEALRFTDNNAAAGNLQMTHMSEFRVPHDDIGIDEDPRFNSVDCLELAMAEMNLFTFDEKRITAPPVEYVTNRLTDQYGLMVFWDAFISEVESVNPRAWCDLVNGHLVAGVNCSQQIIRLIRGESFKSYRTFGSFDKTPSEEAMIAIYSPVHRRSGTGGFSARSQTSGISLRWQARFQEVAEKTFSDSDYFKSNKEALEQALAILGVVEAKIIKEIEQEEEEREEDVLSGVLNATESPLIAEFMPIRNSSSVDMTSELTTDVLNILYNLLKVQLGITEKYTEDAISYTYYLKGTMHPDWATEFDLSDRNAYFCHSDKHWTVMVTGMRLDSSVEFYDSLASDAHFRSSLSQFQRLFPGVSEANVHRMETRRQTTPSCGHTSFFLACHRLLGWAVPPLYTDRDVRLWVDICLDNNKLFRMPENYSNYHE